MNKETQRALAGIGLVLCGMMLGIMISIRVISAYPYELLPNGTIVDNPGLNVSGDKVDIVFFNNSLYLVPYTNHTINYTNYTIVNQTNYYNVTNVTTFTNYTCINCTNVTNHTIVYLYNGSTNVYTKAEVDSQISSVRSSITTPDLTNYATKDYVNSTLTKTTSSNTGTWGLVIGIIALLLALVAVWMIFANG